MSTQEWLVNRQAGVRAFHRRRPWVMDTVVAVAIVLFSISSLVEAPLRATIATLTLLPPLYWRRRQPFPAFLVTAATVLAQGWLGVEVGAEAGRTAKLVVVTPLTASLNVAVMSLATGTAVALAAGA